MQPQAKIIEFVLNSKEKEKLTFDTAYNVAAAVQGNCPGFLPIELVLCPDGTWLFRLMKL